MVEDHSDSERGNPLTPLGLLFFDYQQDIFYMHHYTVIMAHTTAVVLYLTIHLYDFIYNAVKLIIMQSSLQEH